MTDADIVLVFLWVGITVYAVLAGADFGGGVWDLLAGPTEVGQAQRRRIAASIGPVWEANHVWLIFALVVAWTGFPVVFAAIASTLYIPLTVVAFGIIARGAAFAFRKASRRLSTKWAYGSLFAGASLVTPFFLGMIAGAIASGRVPPGIAQGDVVHAWTGPTSFVGGTVAVAGCAFLSATFLAVDARRDGQDDLADAFRRRALATGVVVAVLTVVAAVVIHADAPVLATGLGGRALPIVIISAMLSLTTLAMLWYRHLATVRVTAALAVLSILWAWAAAQYPDLLAGTLTVTQAAAPHATLVALIVALVVGSLVLLPALGLLFWVIRRPAAAGA